MVIPPLRRPLAPRPSHASDLAVDTGLYPRTRLPTTCSETACLAHLLPPTPSHPASLDARSHRRITQVPQEHLHLRRCTRRRWGPVQSPYPSLGGLVVGLQDRAIPAPAFRPPRPSSGSGSSSRKSIVPLLRPLLGTSGACSRGPARPTCCSSLTRRPR
jgi:hypothetical protein